MSLTTTSPRLNPQRGAPYRRQRLGDILDAIEAGLESAGFAVDAVCGDGFAIRTADGRSLVGEFRASAGLDLPDDDEFELVDDPDSMPERPKPGTEPARTADTTLTPEEQEWKEQLAPFSRNQTATEVHRDMARALTLYERYKRLP